MTHDLLVIGGGAGGMAAARAAVHMGRSVALVQDGEVGGDCTFTGCVPSKTLIESAARGETFAGAMARVRATVDRIAATETADVLRGEGIDVIEGRARLTGRGSAVVDGRALRAGRIVLATGAAPLVPGLPGIADGPFLTNDTVWDLRRPPASMVVLGGGAIGCELAQAFSRLGVRTTVVEALDRLLAKEEPEAGRVVHEVLAREGLDVRLGARVTRVEHPQPGCVRVVLDDRSAVEAEHLLVAVGRRPVTDGLHPEAAGVATDDRGFVTVDDRLATSASGVYAVGDVTGRLQFTHAADEMGRTAAGERPAPPRPAPVPHRDRAMGHVHLAGGGPGRHDRVGGRRARGSGRVPADVRGRPRRRRGRDRRVRQARRRPADRAAQPGRGTACWGPPSWASAPAR